MTTVETRAPMTTSELLLEADQRRPRSKQTQFGMSELGGCRRRAGYRLAGVAPSNTSGSVQAVMGTAIHAAIAEVLADVAQPGDLVEHEVTFAGILGHLDRYEAAKKTLVDVKTTSSRWLDHIKSHGPDRSHLWQTHAYAAALIAEGHDVRWIRIDYLARDTGEEHSVTRRFDPNLIKEALGWVAEVRSTDVEMLPRDYDPDGPFCGNCPFRDTCWAGAVTGRDLRSVLYLEDPDAQKWAEQLWAAREAKKAAEALEDEAKGALDALRPNVEGTVTVDVGWRLPLKWQISKPSQLLDRKAIESDYKKAGAPLPIKPPGKPTVKLMFAEPEVDEP